MFSQNMPNNALFQWLSILEDFDHVMTCFSSAQFSQMNPFWIAFMKFLKSYLVVFYKICPEVSFFLNGNKSDFLLNFAKYAKFCIFYYQILWHK